MQPVLLGAFSDDEDECPGCVPVRPPRLRVAEPANDRRCYERAQVSYEFIKAAKALKGYGVKAVRGCVASLAPAGLPPP